MGNVRKSSRWWPSRRKSKGKMRWRKGAKIAIQKATPRWKANRPITISGDASWPGVAARSSVWILQSRAMRPPALRTLRIRATRSWRCERRAASRFFQTMAPTPPKSDRPGRPAERASVLSAAARSRPCRRRRRRSAARVVVAREGSKRLAFSRKSHHRLTTAPRAIPPK